MNREELKSLFAQHTPTAEQTEVMVEIRKMAYNLAGTVLANSPSCAEQIIAIRRIHEGLIYANLAILSGASPIVTTQAAFAAGASATQTAASQTDTRTKVPTFSDDEIK